MPTVSLTLMEDLAESSTKSSTGGAQGGHNSTASRGPLPDPELEANHWVALVT